MSERRTGAFSRIVSMILAVVMLIGMVPAGTLDLSVFAAATEHSFDATKDVAVGTDKDTIPENTVYNGYFTVTGTVTQRVSNGKVTSVEVGKNGTGSIQFAVTGTATVEVQFSSTGSSNTSAVGIQDASGTLMTNNEGITEVTGASGGETVLTYTLPAGTYSVVSPQSSYNRGARVYYIKVTEEASVEPTAPPAPPEPSEPEGGGTYIQNFTEDGMESDFFTITGNLATNKGTVSYAGLTLTQCLKIETDTVISFSAPSKGTLTLVFVESAPNIKVDGTKVTGSNGVITVDVAAGSHTITKADIMNLFYMVYAPEAHEHSYTPSVTTEATCTTNGVRTYTCSCGDSYTEEIAALGHNYVDGTCTNCSAEDPNVTHNYTVEMTYVSTSMESGDMQEISGVLLDNGVEVEDATYSWKLEPKDGVVSTISPTSGKTVTLTAGKVNETFTVKCEAYVLVNGEKKNVQDGTVEVTVTWKVDCTDGFMAEVSEGVLITEETQTWTFHSKSDVNADQLYHTPSVLIWSGSSVADPDHIDEALVRSDWFAYTQGSRDNPLVEFNQPEDAPADTNAWLAEHKAGVEVKVTARLAGDSIVVAVSDGIITNTYIVPRTTAPGEPIYLSATGEKCVLTGWQSTNEHIDIKDAVKAAGGTVEPEVPEDGWMPVNNGNTYYLVESMTEGKVYVLGRPEQNSALGVSITSSGQSMLPAASITGGKGTAANTPYTLGGTIVHWQVDGNGHIYTVVNNANWYIRLTGTSDNDQIELTTSVDSASVFTFEKESAFEIKLKTTVNGTERWIQLNSSGANNQGGDKHYYVSLYELKNSYGAISGTEVYTCVAGDNTLTADAIKQGIAVWSNTVEGAAGAQRVTDASRITYTWDKPLNTAEVGTYTMTVLLDGSPVGTVTVNVTGWEDIWTKKTTNSIWADAGDKLIFTISGDVAAGDWGWLDNLVIYNNGNAVQTLDLNKVSTAGYGWELSGFKMDNESETWVNNDTAGLNLSCGNTASHGSAVYTYDVTQSGNYHFGYDIIGTEAVVALPSKAEVVKPTYTLIAPDGTPMDSYKTFDIEVGQPWTPTLKVNYNGIDISSQYYFELTSANPQAATANGSSITGNMADNTTVISYRVYKLDGTLVHTRDSVATLSVIPDHWVDCTNGFMAEVSPGFLLTEEPQTWTFDSKTVGTGTELWRTPSVLIWSGSSLTAPDHIEEGLVRSDWFAYANGSTDNQIFEFGTEQNAGDETGQQNWLNANKNGVKVKVTAQLVGNSVVVAISNNGITNTYIIPKTTAPGDPVYLSVTGDSCVMDNCQTDEGDLDIQAAVEQARKSALAGIEHANIWANYWEPTAAAPTVTYDGNPVALENCEIVYTINGNAVTLENGNTFKSAIPQGTAIARANLRSVTVNGERIELSGVFCDFEVKALPWWYGKETNRVTAKKGDLITFVYSGNMPGANVGGGYLDDLKVFGPGFDENGTLLSKFDNGTDGWAFVGGLGEIQETKDINGDGQLDVYKSLRLWRAAGQNYTGLAATYTIVAPEDGEYYFVINEMIEVENGIGTMMASAVVNQTLDLSKTENEVGDYDPETGKLTLIDKYQTTLPLPESLQQCQEIVVRMRVTNNSADGAAFRVFTTDNKYDASSNVFYSGNFTGTQDFEFTLKAIRDNSGKLIIKGPDINTELENIVIDYVAVEVREKTGDHQWSSTVTTAPNCTEAGVRTHNCTCGNSYTEAIPATGHNFVDGICTLCGEKESADVAGSVYIHNVGIHNMTSDFYTFEKCNYKNDEYTYDGVTYAKGIKIESDTKIGFDSTVAGEGTLYLIFDQPNCEVKIDGVTYETNDNGTLTLELGAGKHTITKDESCNLYYMAYTVEAKDGVTVTQPDPLYIGARDNTGFPTVDLNETVRHNGQPVSSGSYDISWAIVTGDDLVTQNEVISVNPENGLVTAKRGGNAVVRATVTVGGETYTVDTTVTVVNPTVFVTEEISLIHGSDSHNSATISAAVYGGGVQTDSYSIRYVSNDPSVVTVDPTTGAVTTVGAGDTTITAYLDMVNGLDVSTVGVVGTTNVHVEERELNTAYLNNYDYIVPLNATPEKLQQILQNMVLSMNWNTGEVYTSQYTGGTAADDHGGILHIDLENISTATPGFQTAIVTYIDANGNEAFRDTIWIHIEDADYDPSKFDGTVMTEHDVRYELETDGIDVNQEYIIVGGSHPVALRNPDPTATYCTTAAGVAVELLNDGQTLEISAAEDHYAAWLIDTQGETINGYTRYNASNFLSYLGVDAQMLLIHYNVEHIYIKDLGNGVFSIALSLDSEDEPLYYLNYNGSDWEATTNPSTVRLYRKHVSYQDYGVNLDLEPQTQSMPVGYVTDVVPYVEYNETTILASGEYTIVWSSSDPSIATVNQNGEVTGVRPGTVTITAKLVDVLDFEVICNTHQVPYIEKTASVTVVAADVKPVLTPSLLEIGVGNTPNLEKVNVQMTYPGLSAEDQKKYNYNVAHELLSFNLVDAAGTIIHEDGSSENVIGFTSRYPGTFTVDVSYAGQTFPLTIKIVDDPYAGLEDADAIPGYPDPGAVRMDKTAKGVVDFNATGVVQLELTAAGISTSAPVDVVLIVDVSNSMGWSMDWFKGLSEDQLGGKGDVDKVKDSNGNIAADNKLDMAMDSAREFADILLNNGGDNSITFVTFAGDHGADKDYIDSVRTPFVGVKDYTTAKNVFDDTYFEVAITYDDEGNEKSVSYTLSIGGNTEYAGDEAIKGANRGNTNYDYAFGEATEAVAKLKAQWSRNNDGKDYDTESGRQVHVVFMTDGAPSHYNGQRAQGNRVDLLWNSSTVYPDAGDYLDLKEYSYNGDDNNDENWLVYIKNYHKLATELKSEIYGAYSVGFDLAHGGFGSGNDAFTWSEDEMERVLMGMAKNTVVPVTLASNETELRTFYSNLAKDLAYAGTNARVTDKLGNNFTLFTGTHLYSEDIIDGEIMSQATYNAMNALDFSVEILSYRLVMRSDIGNTMDVVGTDGQVIEDVQITKQHLGLRVSSEEPQVIETIRFVYDPNTKTTYAYSDVKGDSLNILTTNPDGIVTINAQYFTYTKKAPATVDGKEVTDELIEWKIGNITDREIAMSYYAYLEGALDNPREAVDGMYQTNEYAYLEYVDVYGKYAKRDYGVPQIAWGKAGVTVRFYLVNEQGQFVNRAGVIFDNPANRIILNERAFYEFELNNRMDVLATDALRQAALGAYELYDTAAHVVVVNSTTKGQGNVYPGGSKNNITSLLFINDVMNDRTYTQTVIDIPVILRELGHSDRPMADKNIVIDYGKPIVIDPFVGEERWYAQGCENIRNGITYWYQMEIVGFAPYDPKHVMNSYVPLSGVQETLTTDNGTYTLAAPVAGTNRIEDIVFTPNGFLEEVEKVFVAVKFAEYYNKGGMSTNNDMIIYKLVNIVPATVMYYETDGNVGDAFSFTGTHVRVDENGNPVTDAVGNPITDSDWSNVGTPGTGNQDMYRDNKAYGYDGSYMNDPNFSNGSGWFAKGTDIGNAVTTSFTFTGTGFDIISRTNPQQGQIRVRIYDSTKTTLLKTILVLNRGDLELYQIPVVSADMGAYGTYYVEIGVYNAVNYGPNHPLNRGNEFYFDAIRIYNPIRDSEQVTPEGTNIVDGSVKPEVTVADMYKADGEYKPEIYEVGNLLTSLEAFNTVLDGESASGAIYLDCYRVEGEDVDVTNAVETYKKYGANNEVYLHEGQGIAFYINSSGTNPANIHIGAKSVTGDNVTLKAVLGNQTSAPYTATLVKDISTSTAQFYDLGAQVDLNDVFADQAAYVVIWNPGDGNAETDDILSITDIKIAYEQEPAAPMMLMFTRRLAATAVSYMRASQPEAPETVDPSVNGVQKDSSGNWYYYVNGEVDTSYTGLAENSFGTWYVQNGVLDFSYNGVAYVDGEIYSIKGGMIAESVMGLQKLDGQWMHFVNGKVDQSYTGLTENVFGVWYAENGFINFNYTGLVEKDGKLYYIRYGQHVTTFEGLVRHEDGRWLYVSNGFVDYNYTGLAKNDIGWWYVENGTINFNYTGYATNFTGTYYVKHGQVDFSIKAEQ